MKTLALPFHAVFFDLDGTLIDSAPDLANALAAVCRDNDETWEVPPDWIDLVPLGARAMLGSAFGEIPEDLMNTRVAAFLTHYKAHIFEDSSIFEGVEVALGRLGEAGMPMAVVTNKHVALAESLLDKSGLSAYFSVVIGGDSASAPKPSPQPVLVACDALAVDPSRVLMVGDDRRDVVSAKEAGAQSALALWGYGCQPVLGDPTLSYHTCQHPTDLIALCLS